MCASSIVLLEDLIDESDHEDYDDGDAGDDNDDSDCKFLALDKCYWKTR